MEKYSQFTTVKQSASLIWLIFCQSSNYTTTCSSSTMSSTLHWNHWVLDQRLSLRCPHSATHSSLLADECLNFNFTRKCNCGQTFRAFQSEKQSIWDNVEKDVCQKYAINWFYATKWVRKANTWETCTGLTHSARWNLLMAYFWHKSFSTLSQIPCLSGSKVRNVWPQLHFHVKAQNESLICSSWWAMSCITGVQSTLGTPRVARTGNQKNRTNFTGRARGESEALWSAHLASPFAQPEEVILIFNHPVRCIFEVYLSAPEWFSRTSIFT